jgi:hypothetical protein
MTGEKRLFETLEIRRHLSVAEPNGSFDLASVDTNNIYGETNYTNSDSVASYDPDDYYKFYNLFGKSHLYAVVNGLSSDADLYIYDQNKNLLAQSRNGSNNSEVINVDLPANQYWYARVNKYGGGSTSYNLLLYNDYSGSSLSTARDIGVSWGQTTERYEAYGKIFWNDYLDYRDNVDIVKFKLETKGTIDLRRRNSQGNLQGGVQLLDANGNVLRTLSGNSSDGYNLANFSAPAGTYYMKIWQTSGNGEYQFRVTSDYAGESTATARDLGDVTGSSREYTDMVGGPFLPTYEDDKDLYKFKLNKTSPIDFWATINTSSFPSPTFGAKFGLAKDNNNNGFIDSGEVFTTFSPNARFSQTLGAGTYYVVVTQNGAYTTYKLDVDSDFDAVNGDPKAYSNMSKAQNLGALTSSKTLNDGFGISAGDIADFYKFSLSATTTVKASTSVNNANSRNTGKPNLTFVKDKNNNGRFDTGENLVPFAQSLNTSLGAGTYFLYCAGGGGQTAYSITLGPGTVNDPDDTFGEIVGGKNVMTLGTSNNFTLDPLDDVDIVRFTVSKNQKVGFDVTSLNGAALDTYLRLFKSDGTQLSSNNDGKSPTESSSGKDSYLSYTFGTAGTYYIGVSANPNKSYNPKTGSGDVKGTKTGAYRLALLNLTPTKPASAPFAGTALSDDTDPDSIV